MNLAPLELLEMVGQTGPPVRLAPIIEAVGKEWEFADVNYPRVTETGTILVPRSPRSTQPDMNLAIAHDLYQAKLGIPGGYTDIALPHMREQEQRFDAWARSLVMPAPWFKRDAAEIATVDGLSTRYIVSPSRIIDRAIELEICHLICRGSRSYRHYTKHHHWAQRRTAYFATHPYCEVECAGRACGNRAAVVHHLPAGYRFLGREKDEHLRSVCIPHHQTQHPRKGQLTLDV